MPGFDISGRQRKEEEVYVIVFESIRVIWSELIVFTHFIAMFLSLLIGYSGPTCLTNLKKEESNNVRRRVITFNSNVNLQLIF